MIEHTMEVASPEISLPPEKHLKHIRQYVLLISSTEADLSAVLHRVGELASCSDAEVRFVGLCSDQTHEPAMRRALVTMAAVMRSGGVDTQIETLTGQGWTARLQESLGPEDMLVCWGAPFEEPLNSPLSHLIRAKLDAPLYILSGSQDLNDRRLHWLLQAAAWIGSVVIVAGFFVLQTRLNLLGGSLAILMESLSVVVEVVLICAWNALLA